MADFQWPAVRSAPAMLSCLPRGRSSAHAVAVPLQDFRGTMLCPSLAGPTWRSWKWLSKLQGLGPEWLCLTIRVRSLEPELGSEPRAKPMVKAGGKPEAKARVSDRA